MYNRNNPYLASIKERFPLTLPASTKKTWHITLHAEIPFAVGDSVAVLAHNDPLEVEQIMQVLRSHSQETYQFLLTKANLHRVTPSFIKNYAPTLYSENIQEFLHT